MLWFDSHCHLHLCGTDGAVDQVVARARRAGVVGMLTVGIDLESSRAALELAARHDLVAAAGVHPNSASEFEASAAGIAELLADEKVVAVGETGLDFYRDSCPRDVQESAFAAHIDLARTRDKALVIHTRESVDAALDVLEQMGPPDRFVFHCWSGDADQLRRALAAGAFVSFAGNVSFRNAAELRAVAAVVPDDRLLIETDSPFLSPEPYRGKTNEPARVVHVGEAVAAARGDAAIDELTTANARRFLKLDS